MMFNRRSGQNLKLGKVECFIGVLITCMRLNLPVGTLQKDQIFALLYFFLSKSQIKWISPLFRGCRLKSAQTCIKKVFIFLPGIQISEEAVSQVIIVRLVNVIFILVIVM